MKVIAWQRYDKDANTQTEPALSLLLAPRLRDLLRLCSAAGEPFSIVRLHESRQVAERYALFLFSRLSRLLRDRCDGYCRPRRAAAAAAECSPRNQTWETRSADRLSECMWMCLNCKSWPRFHCESSQRIVHASKTLCTASYLLPRLRPLLLLYLMFTSNRDFFFFSPPLHLNRVRWR